MNRGATKDYKFGSKNHWRRTLWNEVLSRTAGRERQHPILYLAGAADLDRQVAIDKGVPSENLIAVESKPAVVEQLRKRGVPVVQGGLLDVLWAWPTSRPVAAVIADYCSGLVWDVMGLYDCFEREPLADAVLAVNFMRGRDANINAFRDLMVEHGLMHPLWSAQLRRTPEGGAEPIGEPALVADVKHRAYQFVFYHAFDTLQAAAGYGSAQLAMVDTSNRQACGTTVLVPPDGEQDRDMWRAVISKHILAMGPRFFSYRSTSGQVFDSAVLWHLAHRIPPAKRAALHGEEKSLAWREATYRKPSLVRSIAARLAIRTQRLRRGAEG